MPSFKNILIPNRHNGYMPAIVRLPFILVAVLTFAGLQLTYNYSATGQAKILGYASNISSGSLLSGTNSQRAANGLAALRINSQLNVAAQNKANHMIANDYWAHVAPDGTTPWYFVSAAGYSYRSAAENLAYGFDTSAGVINGWMASPGHAVNLLGDFQDVGFGIANGSNFQGDENTVVVAMYGKPAEAAPPAPVDKCANISGNQSSVPSGYAANGANCYVIEQPDPEPQPTPTPTPTPTPDPEPQPTPTPQQTYDACSNLSGTQASVPSGYVADGSICTLKPAETTTPPQISQLQQPQTETQQTPEDDAEESSSPQDVCSNIEGLQEDLPENYEVTDEDKGICQPLVSQLEDPEETDPTNSDAEDLAETTISSQTEQLSLFSNLRHAPWPTIIITMLGTLMITSYLFRHVIYVHNLIIDGQRIIKGHPLVEMSVVYVFAAVLLSASTGAVY